MICDSESDIWRCIIAYFHCVKLNKPFFSLQNIETNNIVTVTTPSKHKYTTPGSTGAILMC